MDEAIKWGVRAVIVAAIIGALWAAWRFVDYGWCNGACRAAVKDLTALRLKVEADDKARERARLKREAEDAEANRKLEADRKQAQRERDEAQAAAARNAAALARVVADLGALRGRCALPGAARRVFDDAAGGPSRDAAPAAPAAAPDAAAGAGAPAGQAGYQGGMAPSAERDAAPVDCVDVYAVGARNTARARFNADELKACQRDSIRVWEACTGNRFPIDELAPWLKP